MFESIENGNSNAILNLLGNEFKNLTNYLQRRQEIISEYNKSIGELESDDVSNNVNLIDNLSKSELNAQQLEAIKIKVIVRLTQEQEVVKLFKEQISNAEKESNDTKERYELLRDACLQFQKIDFTYDGNLPEEYKINNIDKIYITEDNIYEFVNFMSDIWNISEGENTTASTKEEYVDYYLHNWLFEKICGIDFSLVAIKTEVKIPEGLESYFEPENVNNANNDLNDEEWDVNKTEIEDDDYKFVHKMLDDSYVLKELYYWEKQNLLKENMENEKSRQWSEARKTMHKELGELKKSEQLFDAHEFNKALCKLISEPNFVDTISQKLISTNLQNARISPENMDLLLEILNFVDLPLKGDEFSKGILDIAGWFNPQMYNNLKFLHTQLLKSEKLEFQVYCVRHLQKIIDYKDGFDKRFKQRTKIAVLLFIVAAILLLAIEFGTLSISLASVPAVVGLGLLAYNYFKSKIIQKAMNLFYCPEWYKNENVAPTINTLPIDELMNTINQCKIKIKNSINVKISTQSFMEKKHMELDNLDNLDNLDDEKPELERIVCSG